MLRRAHVVLTGIVGVPILVWTITGFAFTCFDFDEVRGARDRAPAAEIGGVSVGTNEAIARARQVAGAGARVVQVRTRTLARRAVHLVEIEGHDPVVVDAGDATIVRIDERTAGEIATSAFRGGAPVAETRPVSGDEDLHDPAWRVRLGDARHTDVFVSRTTGDVVAWRNDAWRRFDTLWSIHVFGFVSRDNPAHWPLRLFASLMLAGAASGVLSWSAMLARRTRRRRNRAGAAPC